jgi:phage terminase large subunit GpA-like protein
MFTETDSNIAERLFLGNLLKLFKQPIRIGTLKWAETYRIMTSTESAIVGRFSNKPTPYMEFVYDCADNTSIPVIVAVKSAQIGWSEASNNIIGKWIVSDPSKIIMAFPRLASARNYSREKIKPFFSGTKVLRDLINQNVAKESFNYFEFPNGFLKLITAGSVGEMKSSSIPRIIIEEPDDLKSDVNGQGDSLDIVIERQKTIPTVRKKLIYGGTPTDKDFSKVEDAYKKSNQMVFKAECHHCGGLHELSFNNLFEDDYPDRYIDEIYGTKNPESAYYLCPLCEKHWTFEEKKQNIVNGLKHGNKGWHITKPEITDIYGFAFNELLSSFPASSYKELSKKRILAGLELAKGNEGKMKSFVNNNMGKAYASGSSALEAEEMKLLRSNYPEHIVPMEGLVLTAGIDVQDNRFAVVIRAWGRNNNSWLVSWFEIFGDVKNQDDYIWKELADKTVFAEIPHITGKKLQVAAVSIDSGDNTELVYKWVLEMNQYNPQVFATKGVKDLRFSDDEIYREPANLEFNVTKQYRKSMAETMGVSLFLLGAHKAHNEILNRVILNNNKEARSNIYYFNQQSYGMYEEQMTSCRRIVDANSGYNKAVYKLIAGKRKEAIDAEKNALHASYAIGLRNYGYENWKAIEDYLYNDR